jgi:hypothetical protein
LTSTYFGGQAAANDKAKRGYARDHRPDCRQVVVGLVVNRDGLPIAHGVFEGNTQDPTTLTSMLDRRQARVGLPAGATIVVDRGMAYDENIAEIKTRKLHYLVASRQPERTRWLAEFGDPEGLVEVQRQPSPRNPAQQKSRVEVKTRRVGTPPMCCAAVSSAPIKTAPSAANRKAGGSPTSQNSAKGLLPAASNSRKRSPRRLAGSRSRT